ncbi:MAG: hypothetical protein GF355_17110 [Candidatus Eisenbacteria bacterium]|nr:hypothetical protein [Candidatus Eisenbacteria bacterium]
MLDSGFVLMKRSGWAGACRGGLCVMATMSALRNSTKPIIWFTAIAFVVGFILILGTDIFTGAGPGQNAVLATVNGDPISVDAWERALQEARLGYRNQTGQNPDGATELRLRAQAWEGLIQDILVRQEAERLDIEISDEELAFAIRNQPLPEFVSHPQFQTEGRFDLAKYQAALANPNFNPLPLENLYRRTLPLQKVQERVLSSVKVSDDELWREFRRRNEKVRFDMIHYPLGRMSLEDDEITPGDEVLTAYLEENAEEYRIPDQAELKFVSVPVHYSTQDSLEALDQARMSLEEYQEGEDFSILVEAYSEAPPNRRGGETGSFVLPEQFAPAALRDTAFALEEGEVSGVLHTSAGFHLIKADSVKTEDGVELRKFSEIFIPLRPTYETLVDIRTRIVDFADSAAVHGFDETAERMGLTPDSTGLFPEDGFPRKLGRVPAAVEFAFDAKKVGTISRPIETAQAWYVVQLTQRVPAHQPELTEVRDRVLRDWQDERRREKAHRLARATAADLGPGASLKEAAEADSLARYQDVGPLARTGFIPGVGSDPVLMGYAFGCDTTDAPRFVGTERGGFVVDLLERIPANREAFESQKARMRQQALQQRQNEVLTAWISNLREEAEIEDYRRFVFSQ